MKEPTFFKQSDESNQPNNLPPIGVSDSAPKLDHNEKIETKYEEAEERKKERNQIVEVNQANDPMPFYITDFFRDGNGCKEKYEVFLQKVSDYEHLKFLKKKPVKTQKDIKAIHNIELKNHLNQLKKDEIFEEASTFCKRVRNIILKEENHYENLTNYSPDLKIRQHELFCLNYFCVEAAKSANNEILKNFMDKFVDTTKPMKSWLIFDDPLIKKLKSLIAEYEESKIKAIRIAELEAQVSTLIIKKNQAEIRGKQYEDAQAKREEEFKKTVQVNEGKFQEDKKEMQNQFTLIRQQLETNNNTLRQLAKRREEEGLDSERESRKYKEKTESAIKILKVLKRHNDIIMKKVDCVIGERPDELNIMGEKLNDTQIKGETEEMPKVQFGNNEEENADLVFDEKELDEILKSHSENDEEPGIIMASKYSMM